MMKNNFWITALSFGIPFFLFMLGYKFMESGAVDSKTIVSTLTGALFAGIFYAATMKFVAGDPFKSVKIIQGDGEHIVMEGGALYMPGRKAQGGKLALTEKQLIFRAQKYDTQYHHLSFDLAQLQNLRVDKSWKLMKNELRFELPDGITHRFALDKPNMWATAINGQLAG